MGVLGADWWTWWPAAFLVKESASPAAEPDSITRSQDCGGNRPASLARYDQSSSSWRTRQRSLFGEGYECLETLPRWGMIAAGELWALPTPSGLIGLRNWITSETASGLSATLPTPNSSDNRRRATELSVQNRREKGKQISLEAEVRFPERTPTPTSTQRGAELNRQDRTGTGEDLATWVAKSIRLNTPTAQDASNNAGPSQVGRDSLNSQVGGALNPDWVEVLMGWPQGWTSLDPMPPGRLAAWLAAHEPGAVSPWQDHHWANEMPRTATGVPKRMARLTAIGNGQVPACAALAWRMLL